MSNKILVTDSLFIFDEHVKQLEAAGFEVERLDKPDARERELIEAVRGKVGYIIGGIESVTAPVIEAADALKAIVFTGIGYKGHIPAWKLATKKGITIGNTPDGPTNAVAEWSVTAALAMNRGLFDLTEGLGDKTFLTTKGLEGIVIGILGLGHIGGRIAEMVQVFRPQTTLYFSTNRHEDKEKTSNLIYVSDPYEVINQSDILFLCIDGDENKNYFGEKELKAMKKDALLVSFMPKGVVQNDSLYEALTAGKIRAASDNSLDERFTKLPLSRWFNFMGSNAFNTEEAIQYMSDRATQTLINLLTTGKDENKVN